MMKLIIFGATGTIGQELVTQALERGHTVTAFARDPGKLRVKNHNLHFFRGDIFKNGSVQHAVKGHDAALVVLGAGRKGTVRSEGTLNVIRAMEMEGIRRLICLSTLGAGDSRETLNFFWKYIMFGFLLREAYADHEKQEEYIKKSPLDWTIVRPGAFTNGERTGNYRHGFSTQEKNLTLNISRADVADFMLKQLTDKTYLHDTPGLSY